MDRTHGLPAGVFVLACVILSAHLGARELKPIDEARSGVIVRDMVERGHWLIPRTPDGFPSEKPPVYYLAAAGIGMAAGIDESSLRLVSLLFAVGTLALVAWTARRSSGAVAAGVAVVLLAANPIFFEWARQAMVDMALCFFITAGLVAWRDPATDRRRPVLAGVLCGSAILTKGPIGIVLPIAMLAGGRLLEQEWPPRALRPPWRPLLTMSAVAIFVAAVWYVPAAIAGGSEFLYVSVLGENLYMPLGLEHSIAGSHHKSLAYYFLRQAGTLLPTIGFLPALWSCRTTVRESPLWRRLFGLALGGFLLLMIPGNKRFYYLLPLQPWVALAVAPGVARCLAEGTTRWLSRGALTVGALLILGAVALRTDRAREFLEGGSALHSMVLTAFGIATLAAPLAGPRGILAALLATALLVPAIRTLGIDPTMAARSNGMRAFVREARTRIPPGTPVVLVPPVKGYALDFYWPDPLPRAAAPTTGALLVEERLWKAGDPEWKSAARLEDPDGRGLILVLRSGPGAPGRRPPP